MIAALALGAVNAAMLLGHWYLVTPKLSPAPLRRMMWLLIGSLVLQALLFGTALAMVGTEALEGGMGWLTWLRLGVGILLPIVITALAILASRAPSLQASTGLLYIGLALIMAGSIAGASISYLTGDPGLAPMRVTVRTFAIAARARRRTDASSTLDDGATVHDAWAAMVARFAGLAPHRPYRARRPQRRLRAAGTSRSPMATSSPCCRR